MIFKKGKTYSNKTILKHLTDIQEKGQEIGGEHVLFNKQHSFRMLMSGTNSLFYCCEY